MSKCEVCEGRSQLRLCTVHELILRDTLRDLPWWLDRLAEAAVGQVRVAGNGRRGTRASELDEFTGRDGADKLAQALQAERFRRDRVLAAGRVNARASRLNDRARNEITTWVRHLCEVRGIAYPAVPWPPPKSVPMNFIGPLRPGWVRINPADPAPETPTRILVYWLERHTHSIAGDEAAKDIYAAMIDLLDHARRAVNRATPHKFCGPCPTLLTDDERAKLIADGEEDREECHIRLYAPAKADHVTCPRCGLEYDVKELQAWCWDMSGDKLLTIRELVDSALPRIGEPVSDKWIYKWSKRGDLEIAGWAKNGDMMFRLGDVRELRKRTSTRFQRQMTSV